MIYVANFALILMVITRRLETISRFWGFANPPRSSQIFPAMPGMAKPCHAWPGHAKHGQAMPGMARPCQATPTWFFTIFPCCPKSRARGWGVGGWGVGGGGRAALWATWKNVIPYNVLLRPFIWTSWGPILPGSLPYLEPQGPHITR